MGSRRGLGRPVGALRAILVVSVLARVSPAIADPPLSRIRIVAGDLGKVAAELERDGYDLVPRATPDAPVDLIATEAEAAALRAGGFVVAVVERGRPLAEVKTIDRALEDYPSNEAIVARLEQTATDFPDITRLVDLTTWLAVPPTFNGHHLLALEISDHPGAREDEPAILLLSGMHAREIINPVIALEVIDRLTRGYASDPAIAAIIDANRVWVAPMWNPDGYGYMFSVDNLWRKNRRPFEEGIGVDLNRNFPYGWDSACAGNPSASSRFYRGPVAASEVETQTLIAFTGAERFAKVLELHSAGRAVVWGWPCGVPPFEPHLAIEAGALADLLGYELREPAADGQHHEWQLTRIGTLALLLETHSQWQPPYREALVEFERVWPGILWMLGHPLSITGHVRDAATGQPLVADIALAGLATEDGEWLASEGRFGRYQLILPPGDHRLRYSAPGYWDEVREVPVTADQTAVVEVAMARPDDADHDAPGWDPIALPGEDQPLDWGCGCTSGPRSPGGGGPLVFGVWLILRRRRGRDRLGVGDGPGGGRAEPLELATHSPDDAGIVHTMIGGVGDPDDHTSHPRFHSGFTPSVSSVRLGYPGPPHG